jgi:hypothetical protein
VVQHTAKAVQGHVHRKVRGRHRAQTECGQHVEDEVIAKSLNRVDEEVVKGLGRFVVVVQLMKSLRARAVSTSSSVANLCFVPFIS